MHGVKAKTVNCPAIDGILEEADEVAGDIDDKQVLDAALIAAAQAVEHYEMTRYGTLIAWAKQLGRSDCAAVLPKNLKEEKATDKKLTEIAESRDQPAGRRIAAPSGTAATGVSMPATGTESRMPRSHGRPAF